MDITSGSLKATSLTVNDFDLDMTSGNTKIDNLVANTVNADLTSGRLEITAMSVDKFDADITSGTVVTGFISLNKATYDMTSGRIDMTLPESGGVVKVSKTSGRVNTNRECSVSNNTYAFGTGSADIKVSMTSGTLNIA